MFSAIEIKLYKAIHEKFLLRTVKFTFNINIEESFSFKKFIVKFRHQHLQYHLRKLSFKISYLKLKITLFFSNCLIWGQLGIPSCKNGLNPLFLYSRHANQIIYLKTNSNITIIYNLLPHLLISKSRSWKSLYRLLVKAISYLVYKILHYLLKILLKMPHFVPYK